MSSNKEPNVGGSLGYKLKQTQHALRLHMDKALRAIDLTTPQYAVLAQLELRPGISNAALARFAFITPQTMHGIVSNLEKRSFVKRKIDPQHGRILRTELSKEGKKIIKQAHEIIQDLESKMTSAISEEQKVLLEALLLACFNYLNNGEMD